MVFFALSPFLLVEPMTAWRDITANRQIVVDRAVATGAFAPAARYAEMLWTDAAGVPIAVLAIVGCVAALRSMPARAIFLLAFPLPFLLFISNTAPASRYLNPVLPFMALFAAVGVSALASSSLGAGARLLDDRGARRRPGAVGQRCRRRLHPPRRHANAGAALHRGQRARGGERS